MQCYYVFFFFQAEDGIRDRDVTGVQTCALPISGAGADPRARIWTSPLRPRAQPGPAPGRGRPRSEERRVGKECRSRRSASHQYKKITTSPTSIELMCLPASTADLLTAHSRNIFM